MKRYLTWPYKSYTCWVLAQLCFLVLVCTLSSKTLAQTRCSTDSFDNTTCRSPDGTVLRGTTDSFGNATWRDNQGNTIRGRTDSFGNKTYRDSRGNVTICLTDSFGNMTCH